MVTAASCATAAAPRHRPALHGWLLVARRDASASPPRWLTAPGNMCARVDHDLALHGVGAPRFSRPPMASHSCRVALAVTRTSLIIHPRDQQHRLRRVSTRRFQLFRSHRTLDLHWRCLHPPRCRSRRARPSESRRPQHRASLPADWQLRVHRRAITADLSFRVTSRLPRLGSDCGGFRAVRLWASTASRPSRSRRRR
jgi:hypothetical protein